MKQIACVLAVIAVTATTSPAVAVNLLTNGSFETGNLTGWTVDPQGLGNIKVSVYSGPYCCQGAIPPDGTYAAAFGAGGSVTGEIAQAFTTVPGLSYDFSLQYAGVGVANAGSIVVNLGDAISFTPIVGPIVLQPSFDGNWMTYKSSFVATSALSGIDIQSPNGSSTDYMVDNVLVYIPEPSTLAMLLGLVGIGLVGYLRRRRRS